MYVCIHTHKYKQEREYLENGARGKPAFGITEYLVALRPGALQLIPSVKLQLESSSCVQR